MVRSHDFRCDIMVFCGFLQPQLERCNCKQFHTTSKVARKKSDRGYNHSSKPESYIACKLCLDSWIDDLLSCPPRSWTTWTKWAWRVVVHRILGALELLFTPGMPLAFRLKSKVLVWGWLLWWLKFLNTAPWIR